MSGIRRTSLARRVAGVAAVALAATLALSGCSGAASGSNNAAAQQTLVIGIESEADILDPQVAGGWVTWRINSQIFEPLVTEDLTTPSDKAAVPALKPALAESWDISEDGKTYTFHIRQGVKFQDGTPLDAAAVVYNIDRMWKKDSPEYNAKAAGQTSFIWQYVTGVEATDDKTVVVSLSQPFSPFLRMLAQGGNGSTAIISPTALKKYGNDIADHPVGTGPFTFVERVRGERIVLDRNEDYWGTKPKLEGVVFRPVPDASARVAALRSGDVDMIAVPSPDSVDGLAKAGFQVSEGTPPHVWYLSFNMTDKYTSIPEVRKAINLAIDREGMSHDLLRDTTNAAYDIQAPANSAYTKRTAAYARNIEEAKRLLASVGLQDGFTTTLTTSVDGSGQIIPKDMAEYLQRNLADIGITVNVQTQEWISYLGTWAQGSPEGTGMAQMSWGMTTPYWLYIVTSCTLQAPNGPNVGHYCSQPLMDTMNKAITATDEATADKFWQQANDIVVADNALAPVVNDKAPYVLAPYVKGFVSPSEEWYDLTSVSIDKG